MPPPMPTFVRLTILVISTAILLSNAAGAFFALQAAPEPYWGWMGFEIVMAIASVFGILLGTGRFRSGSGLAAACVAGAWFVGTGMGRLQTHAAPTQVLGDSWFLGRFAAAGLVAAAGAFAVLIRDRRSWRKLFTGLAMLAIVAGFGAFWLKTGGMWLGATQTGFMDVVRKGVVAVLVVGCGVLFCAGAHLVIAAFEFGVPMGQPGAPEPVSTSPDRSKAAGA